MAKTAGAACSHLPRNVRPAPWARYRRLNSGQVTPFAAGKADQSGDSARTHERPRAGAARKFGVRPPHRTVPCGPTIRRNVNVGSGLGSDDRASVGGAVVVAMALRSGRVVSQFRGRPDARPSPSVVPRGQVRRPSLMWMVVSAAAAICWSWVAMIRVVAWSRWRPTSRSRISALVWESRFPVGSRPGPRLGWRSERGRSPRVAADPG